MSSIKDKFGKDITADCECVYVGKDDWCIPIGARVYVSHINDRSEAIVYGERQPSGKYVLLSFGGHVQGDELVLLEPAPAKAEQVVTA